MLEELKKTLERQIKDLVVTYNQFSNLYRTSLLKIVKKYIGTDKINKQITFTYKDKPFVGNFICVHDNKLYISENTCLKCLQKCNSDACKVISEDELDTEKLVEIIEKLIEINGY